ALGAVQRAMNPADLAATARKLMADEKGLLAMDESTGTCDKRFAAAGIAQNAETRRAYRSLIVGAPGLGEFISGAILFDETLRQETLGGEPFAAALAKAGIIPGIKVDGGAKDLAGFPGEKVTEGLDGLRERLRDYARLGAKFAKWRAVIVVKPNLPTFGCIRANVHALARYAALCQEAGLVPIVEPEVLMDGDHTLDRCAVATGQAQQALFTELSEQRVALEGVLLKPNMVAPGKDCPRQEPAETIADRTVETLLRWVPPNVPGVAFLSGGQSGPEACARLNAMNVRFRGRMPWALTYSFSRAIQHPALELWAGKEDQVAAAQKALLHRSRCAREARRGRYSAAMEQE
ncbi:MAG TPA: class I fructose-bisphosphate aldolase, partial [Opitutaceae bacterium]|nr:class I fructose-bisphosphate aldolase [Opitutaceae bacterium]